MCKSHETLSKNLTELPDGELCRLAAAGDRDAEELLVTWDPEFIRWHDRWFGAGARPLLYADTLQAADFLPPTEGRWVAAPAIAAASRIGKSAKVCRFTSPPPDRVNYLVTRAGEPLSPPAAQFLQELREHLLALGNVQVYL